MRISSISNRSVSEVASQFRAGVDLSSASSQQSLDSATLSATAAERASSRERQRALSTISDAASFISVADNAATEVTRLLTSAADLTSQLETEVSQSRRSDLSSEIYSLIKEVGKVTDNATFNDNSVVDAGITSFSYELKGGDQSSATDFKLSIPNIGISVDSLNLSALTEDTAAAASDPEGTSLLIADALTTVGDTRAALADRAAQVNAFAQKLGVAQAVVVQNDAGASSPEQLAQQIAANVKSSLPDTNNLNPLNVQDLLSTDSSSSTTA